VISSLLTLLGLASIVAGVVVRRARPPSARSPTGYRPLHRVAGNAEAG